MGSSTMIFDSERQTTPKDVLRVVWKRAWILALTVVVFVGAAVGFGLMQPPVYEASAKMLVGQDAAGDDSASSLGSDIQGLQQITHTVTVAVASKPVAEDAIRQLDLRMDPQQLLDNLGVAQMGDSQFVELTYTDPDPELARAVVNAVGDTAGERISESSAAASAVNATVWEYAEVPEEPVGPNPLRDGLLALGLGLMLGIGLAFLLEYLDDSWRSPEEVEQALGVPSFGVIPQFDTAKIRKARGA
jgi:capsular polysaccharide biosynthesis protein